MEQGEDGCEPYRELKAGQDKGGAGLSPANGITIMHKSPTVKLNVKRRTNETNAEAVGGRVGKQVGNKMEMTHLTNRFRAFGWQTSRQIACSCISGLTES